MQYFLKAALGPNQDLDRIFVFDPVLFRDDESSAALRNRYASIFSEPLQRRIEFTPHIFEGYQGTADHLWSFIEKRPEMLLFS
jgi:hypothetical protein